MVRHKAERSLSQALRKLDWVVGGKKGCVGRKQKGPLAGTEVAYVAEVSC